MNETQCASDPRERENDLPDGSVFRSAFDSSRTVMVLIDPEAGAVVGANPAACAFYGYGPDEMACIELTAVSLLPQLGVMDLLRQLATCGSARLSSRHRLKSGDLRDVQMDVAPIVLRSGRRCLLFIIHDVTPLAQAERTLREREGLLRAILYSAGDGIGFRDTEGHFREANPAFFSMLGRPGETCVDRDCMAMLDRRQAALPVDFERRRGDDRSPVTYEIIVEGAEGPRHLVIHKTPVLDDHGGFLGVVMVGRDATELRQSVGLLRAILASAQDSIFVTDAADQLVEANPTFCNHMGLAREELLGHALGAVFEGEELRIQLSTASLARETREPVSFTQRVQRPGLERWLNVVKTAVVDPTGRCLGVLSMGRDITEQKAAETALRQSERRLSSLIRQAPAGVFETDLRGQLVFANERMQRLTGRGFGALAGEGWTLCVHPEDRPGFLERWKKTLGQRNELELELRLENPRSGTVWVSARLRPIRDAGNRAAGYLGLLSDISERKKAEALRADVESVVRHDLKSPLASVQNAIELLGLLGPLNTEQEQILGEVRGLTKRMLGLISLSLDLHAMEEGSFVPKSEPQDLCAVLDGLQAELRPLTEGKGLRFSVRSDCGAGPFLVLAERRLLDAVFSNLLKNAAEAAPEGGEIAVRLYTEGREAVASIRNLGEVPRDIRGRFFEKYATSGKVQGTGLGTYSVRLMVRTLGGRVTVDTSEPGATTLVVHLPIPLAGAQD